MTYIWLAGSVFLSSIPYTYVMISHLDALTTLSLFNVIVSSLLWPITVSALISMIQSNIYAFSAGFILILGQNLIMMITKVYHDYFHDFPHIQMLLKQSEEGTAVLGMVLTQVITIPDTIILCLALACSVLIPLHTPKKIPIKRAFIPILSSFFLLSCLTLYVHWNKKGFGVKSINFVRNGLILTTTHQIQELLKPVRTEKPNIPKKITKNGVLPKKLRTVKIDHIFILQLESLDPDLIGLKINQVSVAPYLEKIKKSCTSFNQFYAQHGGGGSSDAELAALSGLFALTTHGGLSTANHDWLVSLPEQLKSTNIESYFFHANYSSYYDRGINYKKLGFKKSFFSNQFSEENRGWKSSDSQFFKETFEIIEKINAKKSLNYLVTIQSHGPFKQQKLADPFSGTQNLPASRDYIRSIYELDLAVRDFFNLLEKSKFAKNSAVILYSDHLSRVFQNTDPNGHERIFSAICGIGKIPDIENNLGSHVDISPTVTDLFGIKSSATWLGNSLLRTGIERKAFIVKAPLLVQNKNEPVKAVQDLGNIQEQLDYSNYVLWP